MQLFEIFLILLIRSADGKGWTFSRDMRQRVTSLYGTHPEYYAAIAANITANHLLIKVNIFI